MFLLYWQLFFLLTDTIFDLPRIKKRYRLPLAIANTGVIIAVSMQARGSIYAYVAIFALLMLNFYILYKDTFGKILFCASAGIIHIMCLRAATTAVFAFALNSSIYAISNEAMPLTLSLLVSAVIVNLAIIAVLKLIPSDKVKIINQHREQQWFMNAWMAVFNLYLLYNAEVYSQPAFHPNLIGNELIAPIAILLGLYILLFFAFKTAMLLGYKEKSVELQQAVYQEQQYRDAATKGAIITYEVNVTKDLFLKGLEDKEKELGSLEHCYSDMLAYMAHRIIYSNDIERFMKFASPAGIIKEFEMGSSEISIEYRRLMESGEYAWVRAVINLVKEKGSGDIIAFACIRNIEAEKQRQLKLQFKAERDPLTGLYNKEMTGKLINEALIFNPHHKAAALFMIDVDYFKEINDHFGHVYGDVVLCDLADKLKWIFEKDDIVGRIGGDEYIAFIKTGATEQVIKERAEKICKAFYTVYKGQNNKKYTISSSVGISVFPKDGISFEELYNHADTALYEAKGRGKSTYVLYEGKNFIGYQSNRTEIQPVGAIAPGSFRQNRIEYVFKILYQSESPDAAIHAALELVANHFSFERGYIFETNRDGMTTSNIFEWCAEGVTPEIDFLQNMSIESGGTAIKSFHEKGIFILKSLDELPPIERAVLEPQGIKSMFQFGIFDNNVLLGFIGFDNCKDENIPSDTDLDEIATICNILATFYVKQRLGKESAKSLGTLTDVMNHLGNYIYVINSETFEVLFMNENIRRIMQEDESPEPCYSFFRGNSSQCEDCPIRNILDTSPGKSSLEVYNEKLHIWIETTASVLQWTDGITAYVISCIDITRQRNERLYQINQIEKLAFIDELTGARNYQKFKLDAQNILEDQPDNIHLMVKLDIDNFKLINQLYGYEKGDEILRNVARAIEMTMRGEYEIFARKSNDEFIALLQIESMDEVTELYQAFLNNFYELTGDELAFKFTFPHGRYIVPPREIEKSNITHMFEKVNLAHKTAKMDKSRQFVYYDESLTNEALLRKSIENKMEKALLNEEFSVYLQPKYYLLNEQIGGAEALVRWNSPDNELFFPNVFIPVFERNGFVVKLDFYILKKVCGIIKDWIADGIEPVTVSVNFSRLHLSNENFVKDLREIVDSFGIKRRYIEIEITETAIYDNIEALEGILDDLHDAGFTMSMDDFGSGYSSLSMLKDLPVDVIKMDRSFFVNQKDADRSKVVMGSVIAMAANLGICIVAEGVEEEEHIDLLRSLHCDMVQGFYYAKPMPEGEFKMLLRGEK